MHDRIRLLTLANPMVWEGLISTSRYDTSSSPNQPTTLFFNLTFAKLASHGLSSRRQGRVAYLHGILFGATFNWYMVALHHMEAGVRSFFSLCFLSIVFIYRHSHRLLTLGLCPTNGLSRIFESSAIIYSRVELSRGPDFVISNT